jgi:hypothetical protein
VAGAGVAQHPRELAVLAVGDPAASVIASFAIHGRVARGGLAGEDRDQRLRVAASPRSAAE